MTSAPRRLSFSGILRKMNVLGALLLLLLLLRPLAMLTDRIPQSYNEGWNAYLALRALHGNPAEPLYPQPGSLVFNNYPPLSFFFVGFWGFLGGDMIVAGRVIALLSLLASAVLVAGCVRRLGGTRLAATAAGLVLALYATTSFWRYVAIDDPQWLAHAVMLTGLFTLLGGRHDRTPQRVMAAALLMVAGGFVKHNLIAMPVAVTIWLALHDRRACAVWCVTGLLAAIAGLGASALLFGPAFLTDLLRHERLLVPHQLVDALKKLGEIAPLLLSTCLLWRGPAPEAHARENRSFVTILVVVALASGLFESIGDGVNYNAHLETLIAGCLAAGLWLSRMQTATPQKPAPIRRFAPLFVFVPFAILGPLQMTHAVATLRALPEERTQWRDTIARVQGAHGQVACETLALCYWAGKEEILDFFNLNQAMLVGHHAYPLLRLLHDRDVELIQLESPERHRKTFSTHPARAPLYATLGIESRTPAFRGPDGIFFVYFPAPVGKRQLNAMSHGEDRNLIPQKILQTGKIPGSRDAATSHLSL